MGQGPPGASLQVPEATGATRKQRVWLSREKPESWGTVRVGVGEGVFLPTWSPWVTQVRPRRSIKSPHASPEPTLEPTPGPHDCSSTWQEVQEAEGKGGRWENKPAPTRGETQ